MPSPTFFNRLADDFQPIENELSEGVLAAYLLGYDESNSENRRLLETFRRATKISATANFADGDDDENEYLRFDVRPAEAVDYFERKRIVTKPTFNNLDREAKAAAFTVSEIYREDVLTAFKSEIAAALDSGQTNKFVVKQFKEILEGASHKELGDFHLESIVRSNMQTAYGVGRRKAMEESADLLPFWQYSAVNDDRTRPTHRALDGIVYPAKHEFWDTHYPPWGFNCRCSVIALLDVPNGYDRRKPNQDTTIAYDADGLPAKAEYLTQVVDLKATKFVGVPKTASLEKALSEAAQAAKDARLLNHQNIPQVVVDAARKMRLEAKEHLTGWDKDGVNVGHFIGDKESVGYSFAVEPLLADGFDVHNHPPESTANGRKFFEGFSDGDLFHAVNLNKKATYAVTRNYLYQMRRPAKGWAADIYDRFWESWKLSRRQTSQQLTRLIREGDLTKAQADDAQLHLIWKQVAKDLKIKYKRFKVNEL